MWPTSLTFVVLNKSNKNWSLICFMYLKLVILKEITTDYHTNIQLFIYSLLVVKLKQFSSCHDIGKSVNESLVTKTCNREMRTKPLFISQPARWLLTQNYSPSSNQPNRNKGSDSQVI
jgi:hypothetical protein